MGSFGGYTISTLLSLLALKDYNGRSTKYDTEIQDSIIKGFEFVEFNYFNAR